MRTRARQVFPRVARDLREPREALLAHDGIGRVAGHTDVGIPGDEAVVVEIAFAPIPFVEAFQR